MALPCDQTIYTSLGDEAAHLKPTEQKQGKAEPLLCRKEERKGARSPRTNCCAVKWEPNS